MTDRDAAAGAVEVVLDPGRIRRTVLLAGLLSVVLLLVLDYGVNYSRWTEIGAIRRLFNMTREDALASWFGVTVTTLAAVTAWLAWALGRRRGIPRSRAAGWAVVALFLSWMAVDDGAVIHERLGSAVDQMRATALDGGAPRGLVDMFPSYTWQVVLLPLFAALGLFTAVFLWRELDGRGRPLVALALGLFALAVGLDFLEGLDRDHPWNLYSAAAGRWDLAPFTLARFDRTPYEAMVHFSKAVEEGLEILAMIGLWTALLDHLARLAGGVRIRV